MANSNLKVLAQKIGIFTMGAIAQNYINKALDHKQTLTEAAEQSIRDSKLNEIHQTTMTFKNSINSKLKEMGDNVRSSDISDEKKNYLLDLVNKIKNVGESIANTVNNTATTVEDRTYIDEGVETFNRYSSELQECIDKIEVTKTSFSSPSPYGGGLNFFYEYLDSLTLLEESALLHIVMFLVLLITVFNILSVFFSNEIIKFFKLESKFPSLVTFFNLRYKFQRYYLLWNIAILFFTCLLGIFVNIIVLY
jgi:hypothetical protein